MTDTLAKALLDTGLIETGLFQQGAETVPFRLRLEMLSSYPDVLAMITERAQALIPALKIDRMVCLMDAVPFGTALSLKTGLPLVYSRGRGESAVYDLVGAYDVGHPACLLLNVLEDAATVNDIAKRARSVGLNIGSVISIVDTEMVRLPDIHVQSILTLGSIIDDLHRARLITTLQALVLRNWLA